MGGGKKGRFSVRFGKKRKNNPKIEVSAKRTRGLQGCRGCKRGSGKEENSGRKAESRGGVVTEKKRIRSNKIRKQGKKENPEGRNGRTKKSRSAKVRERRGEKMGGKTHERKSSQKETVTSFCRLSTGANN